MADSSRGVDSARSRVGLVYDEKMCAHTTPDDEEHPECPDRIRAIWKKLQTAGILDRCVILNAKKSDDIYNAIHLVHSKKHVDLIRSISDKGFDSKRKRIASKFNSIYFNKGSSEAAYLAAGSVIEAVERVASGDLNSAFAVVRPPGHHAEEDKPMGFCLYNNVALATSYILNNRPDLGIRKILIVDWDVHHGNGTQNMFWKDSRVLFFSVHRHDFGTFYPCNDDGSYNMTGEGPGTGYNINVPWEHGLCGDSDYLAVWDYVLIPVAKEFNPDLIIVSAGFDAAVHDPLGGCRITPYGYSVLLRKLMDFAHGKIVLALEGGYNLQSLANSVLACVEVLLEGKPISGSVEEYPFESTWHTIEAVRQVLKEYWPSLGNELPKKMTSQVTSSHQLFDLSSDIENEKIEEVSEDIIQSLTELSMINHGQNDRIPSVWRKELKEIEVWYATYGSNMYKARFLCYIEGGQVEGMQRLCSGSMDKSPPKEIMWKAVSHRLFFGRDHTHTWGPGGVAFFHPESNAEDKAYVSMYRITLEQFNDILHQENISSYDMSSPLFGVKDLENIRSNQSASLDAIKQGWYHNVVYLGEEGGIPIITMTCELSDVENFKSGKAALRAPSFEYANTLIRGLIEGEQLSETEARKYIEEAAVPETEDLEVDAQSEGLSRIVLSVPASERKFANVNMLSTSRATQDDMSTVSSSRVKSSPGGRTSARLRGVSGRGLIEQKRAAAKATSSKSTLVDPAPQVKVGSKRKAGVPSGAVKAEEVPRKREVAAQGVDRIDAVGQSIADLFHAQDPTLKSGVDDVSPLDCIGEAGCSAWRTFQYLLGAYSSVKAMVDKAEDRSARSESALASLKSKLEGAESRCREVERRFTRELKSCQDKLDACRRELNESRSDVEGKVKHAQIEAGRITGDVGAFYALRSRVEMMEEFDEGKHELWDLKAEKDTMDSLSQREILVWSSSNWLASERRLWMEMSARMRPTPTTPSHSSPSLLWSQPLSKAVLLPLTPDLLFLCSLTCGPTCVWILDILCFGDPTTIPGRIIFLSGCL